MWILAASIIGMLAAWPHFVAGRSQAAALDPLAQMTPAPLLADADARSKTIAFDERLMRRPGEERDQLTSAMLSAQYMQRYRETGDVDDIFRAKHAAEISLAAMAHGNAAGDAAMASALLALHRFHDGLRYYADIRRADASNPGANIGEASLDLEIGQVASAKKLLDAVPAVFRGEPGYETVLSRYQELTGDLDDARRNLNIAMHQVDSHYDITPERRAWYHFRVGELDFLAGDANAAIGQEKTAIADFPHDPQALNALARFDASTHDWKGALQAAQQASQLAPLPETLGYEADAQIALGDPDAAAQTRDQIVAVERIGNASHINDRLLAVYYDDHGIRLDDAYAIARRELAVRDDVYTEDTLAWAAAKAGHWDEARRASARAMRYGTQDSRLWYHAGVIALHFGDTGAAKADLSRALAMNPAFHPTYADDARKTLANL